MSNISIFAKRCAEIVRQGWTKEFYARTKNGAYIDPINHKAVCWCAMGAIYKAEAELKFSKYNVDLINKFIEIVKMSIPEYNDFFAKDGEDVAKVFDQIVEKYS